MFPQTPYLYYLPSFTFPLLYLSIWTCTPPCSAYKSHGDRLAPSGTCQPKAQSKGSSQIWLLFVPKHHITRGYLHEGQRSQSSRLVKQLRNVWIHPNSPRTIKGCDNGYFQGTKLQVIFGLRPLVRLNTTIVSIYIAALWLRREQPSR